MVSAEREGGKRLGRKSLHWKVLGRLVAPVRVRRQGDKETWGQGDSKEEALDKE